MNDLPQPISETSITRLIATIVDSSRLHAILAECYREGFAAGARAQREADEKAVKFGLRFDLQPLVVPPQDATP